MNLFQLKVKCNEIWTIFLLSKNRNKIVSYTNMKQNQLLKTSFVWPATSQKRKSGGKVREFFKLITVVSIMYCGKHSHGQ